MGISVKVEIVGEGFGEIFGGERVGINRFYFNIEMMFE